MPTFSDKSKERLATCHPDLQLLFNEVIKETDCKILCGHRGMLDQDIAFREGYSKQQWPHGKHNKLPSPAVDAVPVPLNWDDLASFRRLASVVKAKALQLGIGIVWGGDWKSLVDMPHYELKDPDMTHIT